MTPGGPGRRALARLPGPKPGSAKRMLVATGLAALAIALGVAASGGTYALLASSAAVPGAVVRSGTATLGVTTALTLPTTKLYPGASVAGSAVVSNTGQVPLSLRVAGLSLTSTASAFTGALMVGVSVVATGASCPAVSTTWSGTFASAAPLDLAVRIAPSASSRVCVSVTLPASAPAAANGATAASFILTVDGRQVA